MSSTVMNYQCCKLLVSMFANKLSAPISDFGGYACYKENAYTTLKRHNDYAMVPHNLFNDN